MRPEQPQRFEAMGVTVEVGGADRVTFERIRVLFAEREDVFSRFRSGSELSRLNRSDATVVEVTPVFARAVSVALAAAERTRGLVDPTLGVALEAAGYDRNFAELRQDERPPGPTHPGSWRALAIVGGILFRPAGTKLDLNGVVKSMAVDDAVALLPGDGYVSAGGDLATRGEMDVLLPSGGTVALRGGGIATSGSSRRSWIRGGELQHHLIDPRTGRPARSCWTDVTVAAGSCVAADIAARAAFILAEDGPRWLDDRGLAGSFLAPEGVWAENRTWHELTISLTAA
jgi:thiamine biosynthesis lipoprotein ApbE